MPKSVRWAAQRGHRLDGVDDLEPPFGQVCVGTEGTVPRVAQQHPRERDHDKIGRCESASSPWPRHGQHGVAPVSIRHVGMLAHTRFGYCGAGVPTEPPTNNYALECIVPSLKTYDLFISHAWDYNDEYYRLVKMLKEAPNFAWRNYSVPEHDPLAGGAKLGQQLRNQLRPVNCVLMLAGMYVNHREWIQHELDLAKEYGKPVVGVFPWGQERAPVQITAAASVMVRWNTESIVAAIRTHSI